MGAYALRPLESALGRNGNPVVADHPFWSDLAEGKMPTTEECPALSQLTNVERYMSSQRICVVVGRLKQGKTALIRKLGYDWHKRYVLWYLDLSQPGHQELSVIYEIIKQWDRSDQFFVVDNCWDSNLVDAERLLRLAMDTKHARFVFVVSFRYTESDLGSFLAALSSDQIVRIAEASPYSLESLLRPISAETLSKYEREANDDLAELHRRRGVFGISSHEYIECCNSISLIGHLPEWRHLYMGAYGAFSRPKKEDQVLEDLDRSIRSLVERENGLVFHVISGDSGSGKSALARLVLRRLSLQDRLGDFPQLFKIASQMRTFEIPRIDDWDTLATVLKASLQPTLERDKPIYMIFFDDLFAELEHNAIEDLFGILTETAEDSRIYFLVTSPSWVFSRGELQRYRRDFRLVDSFDTPIRGLGPEDRESLKAQYHEMYGEKSRPDLIKMIEDEDELILIKLALHQNLHYSEYIRRTFTILQREGLQKHLAALLLSSTLSRFYVHFPLPLIQQLNQQFGLRPADKLPEVASEYEMFQVTGFRLFRVRRGARSPLKLVGLPDTVAPLHDRIAQVIYSTWGNDTVPLLGLKLWELGDKVYEQLNLLPETKPILANIFRGMLRLTQDQNEELEHFVSNFGPVQQGKWVLLDNPVASSRWVAYAKYRTEKAKELQPSWEQALSRTKARSDVEAANIRLLSFVLNPRSEAYATNTDWMRTLSRLGEEYFFLLRSVLDELLRLRPLQAELVGNYLLPLGDWLKIHPKAAKSRLSYRYLILSSLGNVDLGKLRTRKTLNEAVKRITQDYFLNLSDEFKTYKLLAAKLFSTIGWSPAEAKELADVILRYVEDKRNWFRTVLFERLLEFIRFGNLERPSGTELFNLLYDISIQIPEASSLTFAWSALFEHLKSLNSIRPHEYRQTLLHMRDRLLSVESQDFFVTAGYPDFVHRFLEHVIHVQHELEADKLSKLLKPLLQLPEEHSETKWVFESARKIKWLSLKSFCERADNDIDRQIRLCMAGPAGLTSIQQNLRAELGVSES